MFDAPTPMKMLVQHLEAAPVPPSRRTELPIPPELDDMVLRCLAKDPRHRPHSAEELFAAADGCAVCRTWTRAEARTWWHRHLPEHAGPLAAAVPGLAGLPHVAARDRPHAR